MARKEEVIVTVVDDLDGSAAAETVTFSIDGSTFEIDLNKKNAKAIRGDFEKWSGAARKASKSRGARRRGAAAKPTSEAAAIRTWAAGAGIEVPARGRLPKSVIEQYHAS